MTFLDIVNQPSFYGPTLIHTFMPHPSPVLEVLELVCIGLRDLIDYIFQEFCESINVILAA